LLIFLLRNTTYFSLITVSGFGEECFFAGARSIEKPIKATTKAIKYANSFFCLGHVLHAIVIPPFKRIF